MIHDLPKLLLPLPQNLITSCSVCLLPILEKDTPLLLKLHCCLCSYIRLLNVWIFLYLPSSMSTQLVSSWSPFLQGWAQGLVHCQHSVNVCELKPWEISSPSFPKSLFHAFLPPLLLSVLPKLWHATLVFGCSLSYGYFSLDYKHAYLSLKVKTQSSRFPALCVAK